MNIYNKEILNIGLEYIQHYRMAQIKVVFENVMLYIPNARIDEFCNIFPEVDWENGAFIHTLKGKYVRVVEDNDFTIYSIKHIVKELEYITKNYNKI